MCTPVWSGPCLSINNRMYQLSDTQISKRIKLLTSNEEHQIIC